MDGGASQYRLRRTKGEGEGSDLGQMPRYEGADAGASHRAFEERPSFDELWATSPRKREGVPQTRAL